MTYLAPLPDEHKRKRRPDGRVLGDGEHLTFNVTLRDGAPAGSGGIYLTDDERERAIRYQVDYEHGAHAAKFAFMGDLAPKFDRAKAELIARHRHMSDARKDADLSRAMAAARYSGA